jgi:hypothetical protein
MDTKHFLRRKIQCFRDGVHEKSHLILTVTLLGVLPGPLPSRLQTHFLAFSHLFVLIPQLEIPFFPLTMLTLISCLKLY